MKRSADTSFPAESISLPSPPAESPSPAPSASDAGPPRKRSRSEVTPEERKEARRRDEENSFRDVSLFVIFRYLNQD